MRPTPDALREQAFAILGSRLAGAKFLDLFAGTGVNSLEALSRGAAFAVLVERAPASASLIRRNFAALGVPEGTWDLLACDVTRGLSALAARGQRFDLAWCDPPFAAWSEGPLALAAARGAGLLAPDALVVLEAPPKADRNIPGFGVVRELRGALLLRGSESPEPGGGSR